MKLNYFTQKIVSLRKEHQYKQREVAQEIGMSTRQYAYVEYGHFTLNYEQLIGLCKLYDISADGILGIDKKLVFPELEQKKEGC